MDEALFRQAQQAFRTAPHNPTVARARADRILTRARAAGDLATCCVAERITTAKRSHFNRPSTRMTTHREPPTMATTASATMLVDCRIASATAR